MSKAKLRNALNSLKVSEPFRLRGATPAFQAPTEVNSVLESKTTPDAFVSLDKIEFSKGSPQARQPHAPSLVQNTSQDQDLIQDVEVTRVKKESRIKNRSHGGNSILDANSIPDQISPQDI